MAFLIEQFDDYWLREGGSRSCDLVVSSDHLEHGWGARRRAAGGKDKVVPTAGERGNGASRRQESMDEAQVTHRPIYDCTGQ